MAKAYKLMRRSIHAFLKSYRALVSIAGLLVFPISASILLSQSLDSTSPVLQTISSRLKSVFLASGLPASSQFFSFLNLKLSQTIFSFFTTLPFTLTFLILAKASVIRTIEPQSPSLLILYRSILPTHLFNSFAILSSNAVIFSLMFILFNTADILRLSSSTTILVFSATSAVLYSAVLANATVVCNLAIVASAMENSGGGPTAFLRACVLVRSHEPMALGLALPVNLGMAGIEALFQHRVAMAYYRSDGLNPTMVGEALLIAYMYSVLVVLDVVVSCKLFESCKADSCSSNRLKDDHQLEEKVAMKV